MSPPPDGPVADAARDASPELGETSTGLPPRAAAALAYGAWWLTGALFLLLEPRNDFVRFHAWHAVRVFGLVWAVGIALWGLSFLGVFVSPGVFRVAAVLACLTWAVGIAAWVACITQAARGRWWSLPGIRTNGRRVG